MALNDQDANALGAGLSAINDKVTDIDAYWNYYNSEQPDVFVSEGLARLFRKSRARDFSMNLCKLAVNTPLNRLWVESWGDEETKNLWQQLRLDREQKRIYKHALVGGEAFVIGWRKNDQVQAGFNDPRNVHLFFDPSDPARKDFAVKVWVDREGYVRAVIYYDDRIVRALAEPPQKSESVQRMSPNMFDYDPVDRGGGHDMGEVPVWRFSTDLWTPQSHLKELIPLQDTINKLRSNKLVASEMNTFRQRIYLTTQELDADDLKNDPNTALILDPGDKEAPTDIKEFEAATLDIYDESVMAEVRHFFTIAHLPRHLLIAPGADASGDAVRADEGPFQEMIHDIARNFGYTWTDMMYVLRGEWDKPDWQDASINNAESQAREFKMLVEAGFSPAQAAVKAFQWNLDEARAAGLSEEPGAPSNLSDRSPSAPRTQGTEDEPQ